MRVDPPGGLPHLELRSITPEEFPAFADLLEAAFGEANPAEELALWESLTDYPRTLAAFDAQRIVGTAAVEGYQLTTPGGAVAMAGVTAVAVRPDHRRRGLLRALLHGLLVDAAGRGEPMAGLWASESVIYGRFGFGWATSQASVELATAHARLRDPPATDGVGTVSVDEALARFPAIYEAARSRRPGMLDRPQPRWAGLRVDPDSAREGAGRRQFAVLDRSGYAMYRLKPDWTDGLAEHTLIVEELCGVDEQAVATLWRWLCDVDLVARVRAHRRPVDESVRLRLADPRRLQTSISDALWLLPLDVPAALRARRYPTDGRVVLEIRSDFWTPAAGRYLLDVEDGQANVSTTTATPEVRLGAAELGACYLGGTAPSALARAGRVDADGTAALRTLDALFASDRAPWCPFEF